MTPAQRSQIARIGGFAKAAKYDSREATQAARTGFYAKFLQEVDPDNVLDPPERERRAHAAFRAHMARIALKSAKARSKR